MENNNKIHSCLLLRRIQRRDRRYRFEQTLGGRLVAAQFDYNPIKIVYILNITEQLYNFIPDKDKNQFVDDMLIIVNSVVRDSEEAARMFKPKAIADILEIFSANIQYCKGKSRTVLKKQILPLTLILICIVGRWAVDIKERHAVTMVTAYKRIKNSASLIGSFFEKIGMLMSRSADETDSILMSVLFGNISNISRNLIELVHSNDEEAVEIVRSDIESLPNRIHDLKPLISFIINYLENIIENPHDGERDFEDFFESDIPVMSSNAYNAAAARGIPIHIFDNSKTAHLYKIRAKAKNFVSNFANPLPQVSKFPQMTVPIIRGGVTQTTNLMARPIDKQRSCILIEVGKSTKTMPRIAIKPLQLSTWHLPRTPSDMADDELAKDSMPPLVLCIDTSGSTESRLQNGESIFEIETYAAISVEQLFQRFQNLGISVPELISVNFSNVTRVFESSLSSDQRAMNLLCYQGGGTTINIAALADIKDNFCMVIITDGEISEPEQTAKSLISDQRITYIITFQISSTQELTLFSKTIDDSCKGEAHKIDPNNESLAHALVSIINKLYNLEKTYALSQDKKQSSGSLVC